MKKIYKEDKEWQQLGSSVFLGAVVGLVIGVSIVTFILKFYNHGS